VSEKNILGIFACSLKNNYQILILFDKYISDKIGHQMTV